MEDQLTQIGIGGVFAVIIIREVFGFIKVSRNGKGNGVTRNEFDKHKDAVQYKDNCVQIVKRLDNNNTMQEKRFDGVDRQFNEVKALIRNGGQ